MNWHAVFVEIGREVGFLLLAVIVLAFALGVWFLIRRSLELWDERTFWKRRAARKRERANAVRRMTAKNEQMLKKAFDMATDGIRPMYHKIEKEKSGRWCIVCPSGERFGDYLSDVYATADALRLEGLHLSGSNMVLTNNDAN